MPRAVLGFVIIPSAAHRASAATATPCKHRISVRLFLILSALCLPAAPRGAEPAAPAFPSTDPAGSFDVTYARGIDISASAGQPTLQHFETIRQQGYRFVIVAGWGGVNPNRHADVQLTRARTAGLLTAGYCYLNFASALDGTQQVREALAAFGPEAPALGFLAIDVEISARNQLSPGLRQEPPDSAAQRSAVARIAEAVAEVQRAGLRAVIYTKKSDWQRLTGDSQRFKTLPLWNPRTIGGDDIQLPDLASPDHSFGGWTRRVGKQYQLDTTLRVPAIPVDLNVFDLGAFFAGNPADGQHADDRIVVASK